MGTNTITRAHAYTNAGATHTEYTTTTAMHAF
eukprot:CAMPEP_0119514244 /NCGR_PEP_ID=MMETSP1344-20130328/32117_1 /TAXON_ID=236787 /ORGANISM="Florenciella parvula, Strain CCMP2471" /LENGTH=31 /DNA_ID= /DNA_START= /DNA_END= /DNA_ORIENTATION=